MLLYLKEPLHPLMSLLEDKSNLESFKPPNLHFSIKKKKCENGQMLQLTEK